MKLNLRDLFWLTLVAALATGWWIDHARLTETIESEDSFSSSIGNVRVEYIEDLDIIVHSSPSQRKSTPAPAKAPSTAKQPEPTMREIMDALQRDKKSK